MRHHSTAFPVGLYGMLLFALCWLTLPAVFAPLERWALGATCVLPRAVASWWSEPAVAAGDEQVERLRALATDLAARTQHAAVAGARSLLPVQFEPVSCVVREVAGDVPRRGGGGRPAELRLDRTYAQLADCADVVTKGDALLGLLQRPGRGVAADDGPDDFARVVLLHHRAARPVGAVLEQADGGRLRLVVRGAASIDPAPLRADLWDDPYRAARLERGGEAVRTVASPADEGIPAGLLVGWTRIWGYQDAAGADSLTIGVFVVPPVDAAALSHVVVWRDGSRARVSDAAPTVAHRERQVSAVLRDVPGAVHGRHLLGLDGQVPDGAAVVQNGRFLGTARGLPFGGGLVTSFAASRHRWSLILLPDDPGARPRELEGRVETADGDAAWVRCSGDAFEGATGRLPGGFLFTGSNGPHCPVGLPIGAAAPHPDRPDVLVVASPRLAGPQFVQVVVGEEAP